MARGLILPLMVVKPTAHVSAPRREATAISPSSSPGPSADTRDQLSPRLISAAGVRIPLWPGVRLRM